ncbi:MAG: BrnT family toxin [Pseudomonadota bacterium]
MEFEWNEEKRRDNIEKHGVDLLFAALVFDGDTITREDDRHDYGETRFATLGLIDDKPYVVIHTQRGERTRLISAWKGGRKEYERYKESFPG